MCSIERLFARMFVRLTCCVSCGIARVRSFVCAIACVTWPCMIVAVVAVAIVSVAVCLPGRAVAVALWCRAVAAVAVAPGRRLGCGGRVAFCVAVVWLRHADEC